MSRDLVPVTDDNGELVIKPTVVELQADLIAQNNRIIQFRNKAMILQAEPFPHFKPLNKEYFDRIFYNTIKGQTRSRVADVYAQVCNSAEDLTEFDHKILFGRIDIEDGADKPPNCEASVGATVWDTRTLEMETWGYTECVWRSPYAKVPLGREEGQDMSAPAKKIPFILSLAGGDPDLYDDIMQSMAPIVMEKKPDGVIWWVGDGANGKSTLMDALYKLFPNQLSSITVKRLVDGRDTPALNGTMANIVKESSEGRIDDTEIYKAIGTHEDFGAHKFHSQEPITVKGNLHHIFSANSIPVFNDKGYSARRRTFIIPFLQQFESDPTFEERTFTPEFFGQLAHELCRYANQIKRQGYRYKFSAKTRAAKEEYDTEANNAEEYANELVKQDGVVAFDNLGSVRTDYENWCRENGYVELGKGYMRRAVLACGFERITTRTKDGTAKVYRLPGFEAKELQPLGGFRLGLYTVSGFERAEPEEEPLAPAFHEPQREADEIEEKGSAWS